MMISIVAVMCHSLAGTPAVCHEELVMETDREIGTGAACANQPALAEWKGASKFAGDQWWIKRLRCVIGHAILRDET